MVLRNRLVIYVSLFLILPVMGLVNNNLLTDSSSEEIQHFNESLIPNVETAFPGLTTDNYSRIAKHDTYFEGSGTCIEVVNDLAFIGYEDEGLLIIDIKHQYEPKLLSIYVVSSIVAIKVVGNYAYILADYNDESGYLQIIDIYDPVHPRLVGSYTDVKAHDLAIVGPTAYLTAGIFGLRIINITNPTNPVEISNYSVLAGYPIAVHVIRNYYVYTAEKAGGMRIYDCSNLTNPILVGKFFDGGYACYDIVVGKDYAYLATDTSGFIIIDIKDLENPHFHSQIGEGSISKIKIVGTTGYFVYDVFGVKIYDVKKFANPTLINTIESVYITDIWFYENYLFATESTNPLKIFDISLPFSNELVSIIPRGIKYRDIVVKDNVAVVATAITSTIVVYNLTCVTDPEIITEISVGGRVYKLELDGSFVYFFEENGRMYALDISNINNIIIYENIYPNLDFYSPSFTVKDDYAYLLYSSQEMRVLSLHDLANVEVIGEIALGRTTDIFVDNNFAYITGFTLDWHSNLLMVNVTQPDNPVLYANYSLSGMPLLYSVKDFSVSDSIIYITDDEGLRIFESIDSNNLVFLSGYNTTDRGYFSILHVTVKDDCAYLTGPKVGLEVINVSDIYNPMKIGQFSDLSDNGYSAASIYQDFIYYVIDTGGLEIVGLDQDSDGLADYFEISLYSSNPLSNDTDNDMISDGYEVYIYHSDPTSLDSDLDTLSDTDEVFLFGTNPASSDTDHDSISDLDEILAGSDPLNPNDPNINYTITSYVGLAETLFFSFIFITMVFGVFYQKRNRKMKD